MGLLDPRQRTLLWSWQKKKSGVLRKPEGTTGTVGARGPAQGLCGGLSGLLGRDRIHRGKKLSLKTKEWPLGAKGKQAAAAETQELKEKKPHKPI